MKRYIYAMAIPKREAKIKINSYADTIQRHLIECVVYGNDTKTLNHWIVELSAMLYKVSSIKCKSKLDASDYQEALFYGYGDDVSDAKWALEDYHDSRLRRANYPDFDITDELCEKLFNVYRKFIIKSLEVLTSNNTTLQEDWEIVLNEILK